MMQQRGEPFLLPFPCRLAHTRQTLGHAAPVLCRGRVALAGVLLGSRPSLHHLRRGLRLFVRRLHRYCGAIRLLSGVHVRPAALGLPGPVPIWEHRRGLPVLVHAVSQRAWGLRLRGTTRRLAIPSARVWPSPSDNRVGIPIYGFRSSIPCPLIPLSTLRRQPRDCLRKSSRPGGSLLLSCKALSSSTACRFIPARYLTPFSPKAKMSEGENVSEIRSLAARVQNLNQSVDWWNMWMIWALVIAAFAAIAVVLTTRIALTRAKQLADTQDKLIQAKDRQLSLDLKDKDRQIEEIKRRATDDKSEADTKIAGLEKDTVSEKIAQKQVEVKLSEPQERAARAEQSLLVYRFVKSCSHGPAFLVCFAAWQGNRGVQSWC